MSYIPKVGEDCLLMSVYKVKFLCMNDGMAVIKPIEHDVVKTIIEVSLEKLSPAKTPAEIEREKDFIALCNIIDEWKETPHKSSKQLSNWILDSQWFGG